MEPLIILAATTAALLAPGATDLRALRPLRAWHVALRGGLAAMLLFTGLAHVDAFGMRADLAAMVPSALPAPGLLVTLTGILELLAGALGIRKVSVTSGASSDTSHRQDGQGSQERGGPGDGVEKRVTVAADRQ